MSFPGADELVSIWYIPEADRRVRVLRQIRRDGKRVTLEAEINREWREVAVCEFPDPPGNFVEQAKPLGCVQVLYRDWLDYLVIHSDPDIRNLGLQYAPLGDER